MRIWKYGLLVSDHQGFSMPVGAQLLTVQVQYGQPKLWALVTEKQEQFEYRKLATYGTGNPIPDSPGRYIGTYQLQDGSPVFHVFEEE